MAVSDASAPAGRALLGSPAERRAWFRYWVSDVAFGAASYGLFGLIRVLPIDAGSAFGGWAARRLGQRRFRRTSAKVRHNLLALSGAPLTESELDAAVTRYWDNVGRSIAEFCMLDRLMRAGRIAIEGGEHMAAVRDAGRPLIVLCVHLGNWEGIGPCVTHLGHNGFNTYLPPKNRFQHRIMIGERARYGAVSVLHDARGLRQTYRLMKEGRTNILMYVDEPNEGTVMAPSLGREIKRRGNLATAVRLAVLGNGCFIPAFAERGQGARFTVRFLPPMPVIRDGDKERELTANLQMLDEVLNAVVRPRAGQWLVVKDLRLDR